MNFKDIVIITERLTMKPVCWNDIDSLFNICADVETMQFWSEPPMQKMAESEAKITHAIKANNQGAALTLSLQLTGTDDMIGQISLFNIHTVSARAEVGYLLNKNHWQTGLMKEAMEAFIAWCFTVLKLRRLEADIDPANSASAVLLKKLGFCKEGCLRERWQVGDVITDSDVYGLLNLQGQNSR